MHMGVCLHVGFRHPPGREPAPRMAGPVLGSECTVPGKFITEKPGLEGWEGVKDSLCRG